MRTVNTRRTRALLATVCLLSALAGCSEEPDRSTSRGTSPAATASSRPPPTTTTPVPGPVAPAPVVVLDPGHNGGNAAASADIARLVPAGGFDKPCNTTGTSTDDGYAEHAFTFDVAQRAAALLRDRGVTVLLTRGDDIGVGPCVDERAAMANAAGAALAVSIHADGAAASSRGFHVIEPGLAPDGGNSAVLDASAAAAAALRSSFASVTGEPEATYPGSLVAAGLTRRTDLAGLNLARVPAVFIECANMRNGQDAAEVTDPAWRQLAAQGIADGIAAYLAAP